MFDPKTNNPDMARISRIGLILSVLVILGKYGNDYYFGATVQVESAREISVEIARAKDSLRLGNAAQALTLYNEIIIAELQSRSPDFTSLPIAMVETIKLYLLTEDRQMARLTFGELVDLSQNRILYSNDLAYLVSGVEEIYEANDPISNAGFALEVSNYQAELVRQLFPPESENRATALNAIEARNALIPR